ncbi:hypothetical protein LTR86_008652 [Recurvomyces mirabilis]|nr:hypothetical protein LTR86_008652 [Recurvomyces mirabilis]
MLSMPSTSKMALLFAATLASIAGAATLQNRAAQTLTYGTCDWLNDNHDVATCRLGDGNKLQCDYGSCIDDDGSLSPGACEYDDAKEQGTRVYCPSAY